MSGVCPVAPPAVLVRGSAAALMVLVCSAILAATYPAAWALNAFQAAAFQIAALWLSCTVLRPFSWHGHILLVPLAGAMLLAAVQLAAGITVARQETLQALLTWGAYLAIFVVALQVFAAAELRRRLRRVLLAFGFVLAVAGLTQLFTIVPGSGRGFVVGPFVSGEQYAALIELVMPLAIFEALHSRRGRTGYAVVAGAMFSSVIAGASRTGALLVTVEGAVLLLPSWLGSRKRPESPHGLLARIAAFAALFTLIVGWEVLSARFEDADPSKHRHEILVSAVLMAGDRPDAGFGLGAFEAAYPGYALFDSAARIPHAQNDWAEWAAEGGVPMLVMMLLVGAWTVRKALRAPWGIGVLAVFVHGAVDSPMQQPAIASVVFLLLGALAARGSGRAPVLKRPAAGSASVAAAR